MVDAPLPDWVGIHAANTPEAPAVVFGDEVITYGDLDRRADAGAAALRRAGSGPGAHVAFPAEPHPDTIVSMVAVPRAGATMMPSGPRPLPATPARSTHPYIVVATSGGRGAPRGVVLTRGNVAAAVEASQNRLGNSAGDRWLLCLPLSHVGGISVVWRSLAIGGCVVLHAGFDAGAVADDLRSGTANMVSLVPTMLRRILQAERAPFDGISAVLLGGAPAGRELVDQALGAGLPILQTYGMTETCSQVATVAPGEARAALGTVGRPLDGFAVTVRGDDGLPAEQGTVGEIVVDGAAVSPGYLGEKPRHGPHRTGDLGSLDPAGRLAVVGRLDDVIITGGENVYPDAVAAAVAALPGVRQCEVFGVPDEEWGEIVVAAVEVDDVSRRELGEAAGEVLRDYEVPKRWLTVPRMPLLDNGKADRDALVAMAADGA